MVTIFDQSDLRIISKTIEASTSAIRAVFFEKELDFYNLFSNSPITQWQLGFTGGYFLNDILILIIQKNVCPFFYV